MHHIAAGKNAAPGGHAIGAFFRDHIAVAIHINAAGGGNDPRGGPLTDRNDHFVGRQPFCFADRFQIAGFIGGHHLAEQSVDPLFTGKGGRRTKPLEFDAFRHRLIVFGLQSGHCLHAAPVHDRHLARADAQSRPGRINRHVAGADDQHLVAPVHRNLRRIQVAGMNQPDHAQEIGGHDDSRQILARDIQSFGQCRAGADENGVIALRVQLVHRNVRTDQYIRPEGNAQPLDTPDLPLDHFLAEPEFRDTVQQNTTRFILGLEDSDRKPQLGKVARHRQPRWPRTDHRHLAFAGRLSFRHRDIHFRVKVGDKPFKLADADATVFFRQDAGGFALALMRADPAAYRRQVAAAGDDLAGFADISLRQGGDKQGNLIFYRAAGAAHRLGAIQTALGFDDGLPRSKPAVDFVKGQVGLVKLGLFINTHCLPSSKRRSILRNGLIFALLYHRMTERNTVSISDKFAQFAPPDRGICRYAEK